MNDPAAGGELIDHVDVDDRVIEVVSRARMRAERLRHRAVYIAAFDRAGRVWVHQRAAWKDLWPSSWDLCFGGVLAAGEHWDDGARRELAEEAGLTGVEIEPMGHPFRYDDSAVALLGRAYRVVHDGPLVPADGEVVAIDRVPLARLARWVAEHTVCPDSAACVLPLLTSTG